MLNQFMLVYEIIIDHLFKIHLRHINNYFIEIIRIQTSAFFGIQSISIGLCHFRNIILRL